MKRSSLVLLVVLAAAAVAYVSVAWHDLAVLSRNGYLYDDSFYAFQIARNIAEGQGATFDGVTPTNGFQPLYVMLLVPVFWLAGGDPVLPLHIALMLLSAFTIGSAYVLYRILIRYVREGLAVAAAAFWLLSPLVIRQTSNGLETALALFMLAVSVHYYLTRVRDAGAAVSRATMMRLGALLGLAMLARLDQVFLVLVIALDYLLVSRRRRLGAAGAATMLASTAVVYSPWLVYGWLAVGRLLPESGAATRFLSLAYAPFFGTGPADLVTRGPDASFMLVHLERALSVLKLTPVTHVLFRAVERAGGAVSGHNAAALASNFIGVAVLAVFVVWWIRRVTRSKRATRTAAGGERVEELTFLLLFAACLIAAYSTYVFGMVFFIRYLFPVHFVATIFLAVAADDVVSWLQAKRPTPAWRRAVVTAVVLYAAAQGYMAYNQCFRSTPVYHFYDVARWVRDNTSRGEVIGVFQSGTIGYLSGRRVVNLDGKVNGDALAALRSDTLEEYLRDQRIDLLMDHATVLRLFLGENRRFAGGACFDGTSCGMPQWVGYRLPHDGTQRVSAGPSNPPPATR